MKKIILIAFLIAPFLCKAQTSTARISKDTSKIKAREEYCIVVATSKLFSNKVTISIDHGQHTSWFFTDRELKDEDGKTKDFNSVVDALNYMSTQGWLFVNAYTFSETNNGPKILNYVMRRPL